MNDALKNLKPGSSILFRPVDASTLVLFRILFGAILFWEVTRYFYKFKIQKSYIDRTFHFTYTYFDFITPLPGNWMFSVFIVLGISAVLIALGWYYRLAAAVFFFTYTYIFLIDATQYNNHYYFIILLSFLLILVNANVWPSLDSIRKPEIKTHLVPYWNLFILQFQVVIVYFFGGIAKINPDWLRGEPLRHWLKGNSDLPIIDKFLTSEFGVYFFSYGGLFFDLSIGFLLLYRKTRFPAIAVAVFFHLTNAVLFSIGIFPFLMIASTVLFLEPGAPGKFLNKVKVLKFPKDARQPFQASKFKNSTFPAYIFIGVYCSIQLLVPLRHLLYKGNVSWTEEGHKFSWHMKLRSKRGNINFHVKDPATGKRWKVRMKKDLSSRQIRKMQSRPDMIVQYAHFIRDRLQKQGIEKPIVNARTSISLNFKSPRPLINPSVNLAEIEYSAFSHNDWILPFERSHYR